MRREAGLEPVAQTLFRQELWGAVPQNNSIWALKWGETLNHWSILMLKWGAGSLDLLFPDEHRWS
jgi:hypothetical protein